MPIKAITTPEKAITEHHVFTDGLSVSGASYVNAVAVGTAAGAIDLEASAVNLSVTGASPTAFTLAAGFEGQVLEITLVAVGSSTAVITAPLYGANTTLTFNAVGDSCTLRCIGGEWYVLSNVSVAVA
jgi:hypothetical protein